MSSTVSPTPNSIREYLEHLKPFERQFIRRVDAVLFFANKGIRVIPLHTVINGICTCRKAEKCRTPGKHPMHKNWQEEATTDAEKIKRMWTANPHANIGLAMGNGLIGIDIDVKNGKDGWKEWQRILRQHNSDQIISLIQATPSGGLHIILIVKDSSVITGASDAIGAGIDIRSDGNLLVGGGSENDKGNYRTFDLPIAKAPSWLEALLIERANWITPILRRISTGGIFNEGERNKACVAYCVYLNKQGVEKDEFARKMREFANIRCIPPYEDVALEYMIEHYYNPRSAGDDGTEIPTFEDLGKPDFKIWEVGEEKVRRALTVLYEYVPQGLDETYELAKRNLPNLLMQYLKHNYHATREVAFGKPTDLLYIYNGRYFEWEPTNLELRKKLEYLTSNHISNSEKNEVLSKLMDNSFIKERQERYVALDNKLLDTEKFNVIDFTQEIFVTLHLPVKYVENADHTTFDKFLGEVSNREDLLRLQEWAGYLLILGYPIKKSLLLLGPTDSGKSTFLLALKEVLGLTNVSAVTLYQLSQIDNRFAASKLYGKFANISPDMPSNSLSDISTFKAIVGRDVVSIEFKYKQAFDAQLRAKLLFSANSLPPAPDDDEAFFNRFDVVVFHKPPHLDRNLLEKLKVEASGILNWMIEGAKRIYENGMEFTYSTPTAEAMDIWAVASNPVRAFFNRCIRKEGNEEVLAHEFYTAFNIFSEKYQSKIVDEDLFDQQFSKVSRTQIVTRQKNYQKQRFRRGLKILPVNEWPTLGDIESNDVRSPEFEYLEVYERVSAVFASLEKAPRERDNIERWMSSEFEISVKQAGEMIDKWISEGLVTLNGRCLEFPERDEIDA